MEFVQYPTFKKSEKNMKFSEICEILKIPLRQDLPECTREVFGGWA